jgi:surface protein
MFKNATKFNQPLNDLDTSLVTNMSYMFQGATEFNQPLDNWVTHRVRTMRSMFDGASSFNQLVAFDTSKVTNMGFVFAGATSFNQSLTFDTSAVTDMQYMFDGATSFNQPPVFTKLASSHGYMFVGTNLSVANITYKCSAYAAHRCDTILAPDEDIGSMGHVAGNEYAWHVL